MNNPCGPCQIEGGYVLAGKRYPPTESVPPYTGRQFFTTDQGARHGECWHYEPMCAVHAHKATELFHQVERAQAEEARKARCAEQRSQGTWAQASVTPPL